MTTPVLITGGTGLLGSAVVANFRATHDHAVVLAPTRQDLDLLDGNAVREWFCTNRPRTVVHAAGHVRGLAANMGDQLTGLLVNARMSLNLLGACAAYPPNRLVVASSNAAYAYPFAELPLHEDALLYGDVHPGEYGYAWGHRTLIAGTTILERHHGIQTSIALLTNLFGPGDRFDGDAAHVVPALIARCVAAVDDGADEVVVWGSPDTTRDFMYSEDAAAAMAAILQAPDPPPMLNVASGHERTMAQTVDTIARACGFQGRITWDDAMPVGIPRRSVDVALLNTLDRPDPVGFDEGVERTVAWYRANRAHTA